MNRIRFSFYAFVYVALLLSHGGFLAAEEKDKPTIQKDKLGSTRNVTRHGTTLFGGQPDRAAFAEAKVRGIKVLVTFREEGEVDWDEAAEAEELGLKFHRFGFRAPDSLSNELIDRARKLLARSKDTPMMLYCGSANRVGAIWMAHRAIDGGLSVDEALEEGKQVGLRNQGYVDVVQDYIQRRTENQ